MKSTEQYNLSILVLSCDQYKDLWAPYFDFFFKYWPDCPFKVYLGTNTEKFEHPHVTQLFSKEKSSWSEELMIILEQIPDSHILLSLEDYFIYDTVDTDDILRYFEIAQHTEAAFLRLAVFPHRFRSLHPSSTMPPFDDIGFIHKNSKYRINLQLAIWEKKSLQSLLVEGESPWEFELQGSIRSNDLDKKFLTVLSDQRSSIVQGPVKYFCGAVTQGKWMRDALELANVNGIEVDTSQRPVESEREEKYRYIYTRTPLSLRPLLSRVAGSFLKK